MNILCTLVYHARVSRKCVCVFKFLQSNYISRKILIRNAKHKHLNTPELISAVNNIIVPSIVR